MFCVVYNNWWFSKPNVFFFRLEMYKKEPLKGRQVYLKEGVVYCRYVNNKKPFSIIRALEGNFATFMVPYSHPFPSIDECIVTPIIAEILPVCLLFSKAL